jgi:uncharacterized OB-fold protein
MSKIKDPEPFEVDQHITAHSRYFAGTIGSLFYTTLRDEKRILGSRCKTCNRVLWPPRGTCGRCFSQLTESDVLEIGPDGTLETFTRIAYSEPVHPKQAPLIYGIIKLDGADTGMTHLIDGVPFETLHIGMRMKPVFAEERKGDILDIAYFTAL